MVLNGPMSQESVIEHLCPLCGSDTFAPYRGRPAGRCAGCGAHERARLLGLVIKRALPEPTGAPVIHFAPEQAITNLLQARYGLAYQAADFTPESYAWLSVRKIDLSDPHAYLEPESVQGLVHSHVLEHVPADLTRVIQCMNAAIQPGGFHLFCVPFFTPFYREDLNELPLQVREEMYGQFDHVRSFGTEDFEHRVLSLFKDFERADIPVSADDLSQAAVPLQAVRKLTSHSAFLFRKRTAAAPTAS